MNKTNKTNEVLNYLKKHKTITSMQAIEMFGATRLSAIIFQLRKKYLINTLRVEIVDRYGRNCYYGKYIYLGEIKNGTNSISN